MSDRRLLASLTITVTRVGSTHREIAIDGKPILMWKDGDDKTAMAEQLHKVLGEMVQQAREDE